VVTKPTAPSVGPLYILDRNDLDSLLRVLTSNGFTLIGPTLRDHAVVYDQIESSRDFPAGWSDEQAGGTYRLIQRDDEALFGYTQGLQSWKQYLLLSHLKLWEARKNSKEYQLKEEPLQREKTAFIGARACELRAMAIQDQVLLRGPYADPYYQSQRERLFIIAVECGQAGGTCFCVSMNAGPRVEAGFDLALTEVVEKKRHYFTVRIGSETGRKLFAEVPHREAEEKEAAAAERIVKNTAQRMGRVLDTSDLKNLLYRNLEHPRWDDVAARCLTCANCTQVCPTCFCTTVVDSMDLTGKQAERRRYWDSCFTLEYSYIHGGSVRASPKSRYRQWLIHKLATWCDQFGESGCVGCGRCITWCPVAIDLTEEVSAIRESESQRR